MDAESRIAADGLATGNVTWMIREAVAGEAADIRRLQARSWRVTYPNDEWGVSRQWVEQLTDSWLTAQALAESADFMAAVLAAPDTFYRVAEVDGRIAGFVHAVKHDSREAELLGLYLDPPAFGIGVGAELMSAAVDWIGPLPARLEVAPYNQRAIRFYHRYGFSEVPGSERPCNVQPWVEPSRRPDAVNGLALNWNAIPAIEMRRQPTG
ncbi:MAG: GNAT family N-acetyltransferase [Bifidobacteriaceae bacterium]|nr:GNAT family N-acetyltransferase [Bifidobacteriaceae bacterium]